MVACYIKKMYGLNMFLFPTFRYEICFCAQL